MQRRNAEDDIKFAKVEKDISLVLLGTMVISSEENIYLNLIDIDPELKSNMPETYKDVDEGVLLIFSNRDKTLSFSVVMPYAVAQKLAAVILSMGWLLSEKFSQEGGVEHGVQGRSSEQEAAAFWQEGSEREGAYSEPADASEQNEPAEGDEGKQVKVTEKPLPA
jgi:hypothetical protein